MTLLSLFRPKSTVVTELIHSIRSCEATIIPCRRTGTPIIYLSNGWSVASVNGGFVSIPDLRVTRREERELTDAITARVASHYRTP